MILRRPKKEKKKLISFMYLSQPHSTSKPKPNTAGACNPNTNSANQHNANTDTARHHKPNIYAHRFINLWCRTIRNAQLSHFNIKTITATLCHDLPFGFTHGKSSVSRRNLISSLYREMAIDYLLHIFALLDINTIKERLYSKLLL